MRRKASFEEGLIILSLEGRNLLPPCSFYLSLKTDYKEWESLGRTEQSMTKIHLFFLKFQIPFNFESFQQIRLQMFSDSDNSILAERIILLSRILRTHQQKIDLRFLTNLKLSKPKQPILSLKAENKGFRNGELSFYLMGKFANISYFIPSIYYTISEINIEKNHDKPEKTNKNSEDFTNIKNNYKTKSEILSGFELIWPELNLSIPRIYWDKDLEEKVLKVSFFMKNWIFSDTLLGVVHLNIFDILEENRKNYEILSSNSSKLIGNLFISKVKFQNKPAFLDYIFTGLDLNLLLAFDFPTESQNFLPYEHIFEGLHEFINEYDSEKNLMLFGYGSRFYEENELKFVIEGPVEKSGCISANSLENLLFSYKELKTKLMINGEELKKSPKNRSKTEIFRNNSQFKPDFSLKKEFLKMDDANSEEGHILLKITKDDICSPVRINRKSSKKNESLKKTQSFLLEDTPKLRGSFQRLHIGSLEEMLLEMSESVRIDMKKPRFSKLKFYLMVILITESIENEELLRAFEVTSKLSLEIPIFTKFVILGNMDIEKFKGNFSLYNKWGDLGRKSRNKGIGVIEKKVINGEYERIMKSVAEKGGVANENDKNELKKTLIRNAVFKGIPKHVVEFFYAENVIPLMNKKESFSK